MTWIESFAAWIVEATGNGFDPDGCTLPAFPAEKKKTAAVKDPDGVNTRVFVIDETKNEFGFKGFGFGEGRQGAKPNAKPLNERDKGEMEAYSKGQKLANEELAALVKKRKAEGATLAEIALETGYSKSYIEKNSAALSRASEN